MDALTTWLLEGPEWLHYRVRRDLLATADEDSLLGAEREAMLQDEGVRAMLERVAAWPWPALTRHNDASHPLHALAFLADLGVCIDDGLSGLAATLIASASDEGPLQVPMQIAPRYGGSGEVEQGWMLCDAPLLAATLLQLGAEDVRLDQSVRYLSELVRDTGWPCVVTARLGSFRGPGRKDDPCPYATLIMLQLLSQVPALRDSDSARQGAEALLSLWVQRRERRPYLFAMGKTFSQPKAPLIWYDILHLLDVLTRFPWLRDDSRLAEIATLLAAQADDQGRYTAGSIWMAWKGWEFAQKREPSRWITFLAHRALMRLGMTPWDAAYPV